MFRLGGKLVLIGAVVAATLLVGTTEADAFWGCYRPVYTACYTPCYTPCYVSCCTVSCDPCCATSYGRYIGYRPLPARRLLFGQYRWYYDSCCGLSCRTDTCCTETGVETSSTSVDATTPTPATQAEPPTEPGPPMPPIGAIDLPTTPPPGVDDAFPVAPPTTTPIEPPATFPGLEPDMPDTPEPSVFPGTSARPMRETGGLLTIYVPFDAKVTINGLATQSSGSRRKYVSHGLKPGFSYKYEIHAEIVRDGRKVVENRTVVLTAGDHQTVAFGFNPRMGEGLASR